MELSQICFYIRDKVDTSLLDESTYISTENMQPNRGGITNSANVPDGKVAKVNSSDILISNIRPYFKKIWYAKFDCGCSNDVLCIRANDNVDSLYLYYLLSQDSFFDYVMSGANGSKMPRGDRQQIMKWEVNIPSLSDQHRISSILSSLDSKIETNNKINAKLEEMAQALFKSWFVDFEPFKDGEMVDSELGMIPKGWKVGKLSDLGDIVGGSTPSKAKPEYYTDNGIAWLTPKDLSIHSNKFTSKGEIDITEAGYNSTSTKLMPRGSVLFSSRAPIGYITIAKNDICTNQGFKSVVPTYAGTAYLYNLLKELTPVIESKASGSTFKEASGSLMKSLDVIIPPKDILSKFEEKVKDIFDLQETNEAENHRFSSLRDTLLPKLMSGEIDL